MSEETTPIVKEITKPVLLEFAARINELKQNGTAMQKNLINAFELYINAMNPTVKQTDDAGAKYQYNLWRALQTVLEQSKPEEFKKLWNIVLAFFEEYKQTVFSDRYIYRYAEFWQWSEDHLTAFQRLINLIKLTSNASTRALGLRKVDLNRSLEIGVTDEARQKLTNFYKG